MRFALRGWLGAGIKALLFDVFGTVVDWRGSVIREAAALGRTQGIDVDCVDWEAFADAWRGKYGPFKDIATPCYTRLAKEVGR